MEYIVQILKDHLNLVMVVLIGLAAVGLFTGFMAQGGFMETFVENFMTTITDMLLQKVQ